MIAAIILAAGESRRMGRLKPLIKFGPQTFLETVIAHFQALKLEKILVVLGHHADDVIDTLRLSEDLYVVNENYNLGQFTSFQKGVCNLAPEITGTFLALVDQPHIGPPILTEILQAFWQHPDKIILPTHNGARGHPPVFPAILFPEIVQASPSGTAASIIHTHASRIFELPIEDERILYNINTRHDLDVVSTRFG